MFARWRPPENHVKQASSRCDKKGLWHEGITDQQSWLIKLLTTSRWRSLEILMAETLGAHCVVCLKVNPSGRPPVSVCLRLVSSLQEENKIPGEMLTIFHPTRSMRGPGLPSRCNDMPFHLGCHWRHAPHSRTGICYGHGWCCIPEGKHGMILQFGVSTVLERPSPCGDLSFSPWLRPAKCLQWKYSTSFYHGLRWWSVLWKGWYQLRKKTLVNNYFWWERGPESLDSGTCLVSWGSSRARDTCAKTHEVRHAMV